MSKTTLESRMHFMCISWRKDSSYRFLPIFFLPFWSIFFHRSKMSGWGIFFADIPLWINNDGLIKAFVVHLVLWSSPLQRCQNRRYQCYFCRKHTMWVRGIFFSVKSRNWWFIPVTLELGWTGYLTFQTDVTSLHWSLSTSVTNQLRGESNE